MGFKTLTSSSIRCADNITSHFAQVSARDHFSSNPPTLRYIVSRAELGEHEMGVGSISILLFNSLFCLQVSLQSHFQVSSSRLTHQTLPKDLYSSLLDFLSVYVSVCVGGGCKGED